MWEIGPGTGGEGLAAFRPDGHLPEGDKSVSDLGKIGVWVDRMDIGKPGLLRDRHEGLAAATEYFHPSLRGTYQLPTYLLYLGKVGR